MIDQGARKKRNFTHWATLKLSDQVHFLKFAQPYFVTHGTCVKVSRNRG